MPNLIIRETPKGQSTLDNTETCNNYNKT